MIETQNQKVVNVTPPAAIVNDGSVTCAVIDTSGYKVLDVYTVLGAADIALTAFKLNASDASGSGFAALPNSDFSVSPATLPGATDDNHVFAHHVDLVGKQRYLQPVITVGNGDTGVYVTVIAVLSDPEQAPVDSADRGLTQELFC